jgi:hypothetical protein
MARFPAPTVPVATILGGAVGHPDEVAHADGDVLVAARADVDLPGLVRLDAPDLEPGLAQVRHPKNAQASNSTHTRTADATST